jgi:DNA-binding NarL/FixJ family response regulator
VDVLGAVATTAELVEWCRDESPDVAILELDGLQADATDSLCDELRTAASSLSILAIYDGASPAEQKAALRAGVSALVERRAGFAAVLDALSGGPPPTGPPERERAAVRASPTPALTCRETDILTYVGRGWTSRSISEHLGISPKTVENHKQRIFTKLGVQNQAHAVALALTNGFIVAARNLSVAQ